MYRSGLLQMSGQIGLITRHDLQGPLSGQLCAAIHLRLQHHALALQLHTLAPESLDRSLDIAEWRAAWRLDGLLIYHQRPIDEAQLRRVRNHSACIWCNHNAGSDCVYYDEHSAVVDTVRRLVLLGHRRIVFVSFQTAGLPKEQHYSWHDRLTGYRHAMVEAGLPIQSVVGAANGLTALAAMLATPERPTAIITPAHDDALGVAQLAVRQGLRIPQQLSLVTFGEHDLRFPGLSISTLTTPTEFLGATAVDLLMRQLELGASVPSVGIGYDAVCEDSMLPPG